MSCATRITAPDPALPEHLAAMQVRAMRLNGLIAALQATEGRPECAHAVPVLIEFAATEARALNDGLDDVSLPRGVLS